MVLDCIREILCMNYWQVFVSGLTEDPLLTVSILQKASIVYLVGVRRRQLNDFCM